jgi:hypothetical protein
MRAVDDHLLFYGLLGVALVLLLVRSADRCSQATADTIELGDFALPTCFRGDTL